MGRTVLRGAGGTFWQTRKGEFMESMGFIFGMMGMTFGLMGFIFGINATNATTSATERIEKLEARLDEAGVTTSDDNAH
ncbi:MAG TPA: hypothetical protein DDW52_07140 [Planctomycetaceae bacterium]|nr:hypothetical protein [Planctomycetaceae bacterium]